MVPRVRARLSDARPRPCDTMLCFVASKHLIRRLQRWLLGAAALACACVSHPALAADDPILRVEMSDHTAPIRQLAVDPTEKWAVTVSDDKTARIWNLDTQALHAVLRTPIGVAKVGGLYAAAVSPRGDEVAVAGSTGSEKQAHRIYFFSLPNGAMTGAIDAFSGDIKQLVWTGDGKHLIASYAGAHGVRMFDRQGGVHGAQSFTGASYGAAVSPQGHIAVPAFDGSIHFFESSAQGLEPTGRAALPIADPVSVSFSPDGTRLVVGYLSRNVSGQVQVDVLDVASLQVTRSFQFSDLLYGNLMHVAWSQDGSKIYAGGTGYREPRRFLLKTIDWPSGEVREMVLAGNSITRLVPLSGGRVGFSTFEPSWGVLHDSQIMARRSVAMARARDASSLKINSDGSVVSWNTLNGGTPVTFDLKSRRLLPTVPAGLKGASLFSQPHFTSLVWEDNFYPKVNAVPIALAPEEVSRAAALLPDQSALVLGTSWNLRKLDKLGRELWRVPVFTEVRALNVTQDSRTIVMALVDGTVHWLRASDGLALLTLVMTSDGRWVLTQPSGYYDTSVGAEGLLGWQVNRPDGLNADFFPVSKFRDRLYRPDLIDRGLHFELSDEVLVVADGAKGLDQNSQGDELSMRAPAAARQQLPPVLTHATVSAGAMDRATVRIDFAVFSHAQTPIMGWKVQVNGRPVAGAVVTPPARADGKATGYFSLARPTESARVQLFARNQYGVSDPLIVDVPGLRKIGEVGRPRDKRPNLYLLAIGVARYANGALNLMFPAKDARDMVEVLNQQEGRQYRKVFSRVLTDAGATRQSVTEGLKWLRDSAGVDDVSILFLAGHGITASGNLYRFLPYDVNLSLPDQTMVTEDHIRDALVNIKGKAIFFIDTCFSGQAIGQLTRNDTKLIANRLSSAENGIIVFSSSDGRQESLEKESWNNGAFTKELIAGLRGKADFRQEGVVTHKGLDYFVSYQVKQLTGGLQTPVTAVPIGIPDYTLTQNVVMPLSHSN